MFFEGAVHDTQNAKSPEEFQQGLRQHLNPGKISEKRLVECLEQLFPYGGVIEKDEAERKRLLRQWTRAVECSRGWAREDD